MNNKEIAALACKVLGILAILSAFQMPLIGLLSKGHGGFRLFLFSIFGILPPVGVGHFLWAWADVLGAYMARGEKPDLEKTVSTNDEILAVAFSVVGLYLCVEGFPRFVFEMVYCSFLSLHGLYARIFAGPFLEAVLGIALFLYARGLVGIWKKMRGGGVPSPCEMPDQSA